MVNAEFLPAQKCQPNKHLVWLNVEGAQNYQSLCLQWWALLNIYIQDADLLQEKKNQLSL